MRRAWAMCLPALAMLLLPGALAAAQQTANPLVQAEGAVEALYPLRVLVPLGINPFLALGFMGLGSMYFGMPLPASLAFLSHPALWAGLLALAILLWGGRSFKVTKPVAEVVGTTESLVALLAFAAMFFSSESLALLVPAADVRHASVFGTALLTLAAMTGLLAVIVVRMGFDLLTWISPFPFVDAALQLAKLVITVVLVAVAIFAPPLAIALNIALLVGLLFVVRWMIRLGRFALTVLWDRLAGTLRPADVPVREGEVGPILAFKIRGEADLPVLELVHLHWNEGGWRADVPGESGGASAWLGDSMDASLDKGLFGSTLSCARGLLFVTARYHRHLDLISRRTATPIRGRGPLDVSAEAS